MYYGNFSFPMPANEPVLSYAPGTPERKALKTALAELENQVADIPLYIDGKEVRTGNLKDIRPPHDIKKLLGHYHYGNAQNVKEAIDAALSAKQGWENMTWENRAHIFLKAAELIATKYRAYMNATTMLGQSKNAFQAEIDAVCELVDFLRFNVHFLNEIYAQQPNSSAGMRNSMEYRPLEGFVAAITPFNFTSIGGNLPTAPAICGNVVVWKPSDTQVFSAQMFMKILMEAGLPAGVINLVYADGPVFGDVVFCHPEFAGVHFTGSTKTFDHMWKQIGENRSIYRSYPRIVGETGGKDFVVVHRSANVDEVVTALCRGAFEFQGQKCSAASRAYIPSNLSDEIKSRLVKQIKTMKMGGVDDFTNFMNAVIDERSFNKIKKYVDEAKQDKNAAILVGGKCDETKGYFIEPTVIEAKDPNYVTMREEIFGPVLTIYTYDEKDFEGTLDLVDKTSPYALTGAVFATDRKAKDFATRRLMHNAGNFYINDKPTGAVVGQQPFGGARGSGTNDKAGSPLNLYRWLSARTIKETFTPAVDYRYPFMQEP